MNSSTEGTNISVIVPVYNGALYLDKCINSILNQSYRNLQVIIVDDGSTDSTASIVNKYAIKDNRIIYKYQTNGGVSSARNLGISIANGDYVAFVDSDDFIDSSMFNELIMAQVKSNADIIITNLGYYSNGSLEEIKTFDNLNDSGCIQIQDVKKTLLCTDKLNSQCISLYSLRLIKKYNIQFPTELKSGEDKIFNLAYIDKVSSAYYIDKCFYFYEKHPGSGCRIIRSNQLSMHFLQMSIQNEYLKKWRLSESEDLLKKYCELELTHLTAFLFQAYLENGRKSLKPMYKYLLNSYEYIFICKKLHFSKLSHTPKSFKPLGKSIIQRNYIGLYLKCFTLKILVKIFR